MASISSGVNSWLLDKYARFVGSKNFERLAGTAEEPAGSKNVGEWKQFSSLEGKGLLQITLIEDKHLMISGGTQIHESYALVNASQWLKIVCKGDSLLFILKINNEARRFRIKFANTGTKTGWDNCHDFVNNVSSLLPVKEIPISEYSAASSQPQFMEDSQLFSTPGNNSVSQEVQETSSGRIARFLGEGSTIPEITRKIMSREQSPAQSSTRTNLPTSDLPTLIRLCLTDPGFPDFVEKVEQELKVLTSQN